MGRREKRERKKRRMEEKLTASRNTPCRRRAGRRGLCLCCCVAHGQSFSQSVGRFDCFAGCRVRCAQNIDREHPILSRALGLARKFAGTNDVQAIQSNAVVHRHDAVPAVAGPVGLVAEADAADVALLQRRGGCCCEEEGESGGEEGMHCRCFDVESLSWRRWVCAMVLCGWM